MCALLYETKALDENVRDGHGPRTQRGGCGSHRGLDPASQRRALFYTFNCLELKDEVSLRAKNISQSVDRLPAPPSQVVLEVLVGPKNIIL